jgi:hypothetical protein
MTTPEITTENYHNKDERGQWEVVKIMIGADIYIDVACREGAGAKRKAATIAGEVKAALDQIIKAQHDQQKK